MSRLMCKNIRQQAQQSREEVTRFVRGSYELMTQRAARTKCTRDGYLLPTLKLSCLGRYDALQFLNFSKERRKTMSEATVEHILDMIDQLSDRDREVLQRQLAARAEAEWRQEVEEARHQARARRIDQAAIDAAIRKRRYGT